MLQARPSAPRQLSPAGPRRTTAPHGSRPFSVLATCAVAAFVATMTACNIHSSPLGSAILGPEYGYAEHAVVEVFDPAAPPGQNPWSDAEEAPYAGVFPDGAVIGGRMVVYPGGGTLLLFDPAQPIGSQWSQLPRLSRSRDSSARLVALDGSRVAIVSGRGEDGAPIAELETIDLSVATPTAWTVVSLPAALDGIAPVGFEGKLYLSGGISLAGAASDSITLYNPAAVGASVTALPSMSAHRVLAGAFVLGRRLHVLGGHSGNGAARADEDVLDIDALSVTATPTAIPNAWLAPQIQVVSDAALVTWRRLAPSGHNNVVDRFDLSGGWTRASSYPFRLDFVTFSTIHGFVIGVGGRGDDTSKRRSAIYDFAGDTWKECWALPTRRDRPLPGEIAGKAYFIGGEERYELAKGKSGYAY